MTLRARRPAVLAATALLALTGCGPLLDAPGGGAHGDDDASVVPSAADVTPLADPRTWDGVVDISLPQNEIEPIAQSPEQSLPATVTDAQGTEVTVADTSRTLALDIYGTLSRTVFELGLGDQVVGRDTSSAFPEIADLPLVTDNGHDLNAEKILELDPTLLITDTSLGPWDVVLQVRDAGIPVVVVDGERSLENQASLTEEIAAAMGVPELGAELGERIETETGAVLEQIQRLRPEGLDRQLRTVFLYVRGQSGIYYMFGEGSGADALVEAIGGYDVSSEIDWKGMKPVTDEALIDAQPDVILMMSKGLESVGGVDGLLEKFPALALTSAGEHERIVAMRDDQILSFGPQAPQVLNALAVALYAPDAL